MVAHWHKQPASCASSYLGELTASSGLSWAEALPLSLSRLNAITHALPLCSSLRGAVIFAFLEATLDCWGAQGAARLRCHKAQVASWTKLLRPLYASVSLCRLATCATGSVWLSLSLI